MTDWGLFRWQTIDRIHLGPIAVPQFAKGGCERVLAAREHDVQADAEVEPVDAKAVRLRAKKYEGDGCE